MNDKSFTEELKKRLPQCCLRMMSFETGGQETVLFCIAEHSLHEMARKQRCPFWKYNDGFLSLFIVR